MINKLKISCTLLLTAITIVAHAQKLPKIQQVSLRAPADIKIDGKTMEWNDAFQAYNPVNRIFYTISNDDDNLYLTMRINDGYGNEKAIYGVTFTIKLPVKKGNSKSKENISVIYPAVSAVGKTESIRMTAVSVRRLQNDTTNAGRKKIDSLSLVVNKRIGVSFKEINVTGIKEIQEPLISIYNTEGIKVAAQFNNHMQYIYELAVPLKYLGPNINGGEKFRYNIKMNGAVEGSPPNMAPPMIEGNVVENMGTDNAYVSFPTDFSGEYILAGKP